MLKERVIVNNRTGIHARPAGVLVKTASKFESQIRLIYKNNTVNAKDILAVLSLNIAARTELDVTCEGIDEQQARDTIKRLFSIGLGE